MLTYMATYIRPVDVHAPKRRWSLIHVIFDGGEEESSLAIGRWDNVPKLAIRWNGNPRNPLGNPQSRGLPTWFIVPDQHWKQILETEQYKSISGDTISLARNFLEMRRIYFLSHCPIPTCRNYQGLVLHSFPPNELELRLEELERNDLRLYHIICDGSWKPNDKDKADLKALLKAAWKIHRHRSKKSG
jgi:hypothetical protein